VGHEHDADPSLTPLIVEELDDLARASNVDIVRRFVRDTDAGLADQRRYDRKPRCCSPPESRLRSLT